MAQSTFSVYYQITAATNDDAKQKAIELAIEQTSELPLEVIPEKILKEYTGEVEQIENIDHELYKVTVAFPVSAIGGEITQFLNLLYGNISLKSGIRVLDIDWSGITSLFRGPRFGIQGVRKLLDIPERPLSCTALKPLGLNFAEIGDLAYRFAKGGIDIIKDDHGLTNQRSAPFVERVKVVTESLKKIGAETGKKTAYFPNITADGVETWRRYEIAAELGADGVLISPQLTGLSTMHALSKCNPALPIMVHPAFSGSYVMDKFNGFTPSLYYGSLWRVMGADIIIYPNANGRFLFTEDECHEINLASRSNDIPFKPSFPSPAGGIQRGSIPSWIKKYGTDTVFLVGGSLYQHPNGLEVAAREFQHQIEDYE